VRRLGGRSRQPPFVSNMLFWAALNPEKDVKKREEEVKNG
jgi:hypothetical protein